MKLTLENLKSLLDTYKKEQVQLHCCQAELDAFYEYLVFHPELEDTDDEFETMYAEDGVNSSEL